MDDHIYDSLDTKCKPLYDVDFAVLFIDKIVYFKDVCLRCFFQSHRRLPATQVTCDVLSGCQTTGNSSVLPTTRQSGGTRTGDDHVKTTLVTILAK